MPLSHLQAQAMPGSSSTSRKRTHAEITRSESRSQTPPHPSKRRRTIPSSPSTSSSPNSRTYSTEGVRFSGDGFDHRQPVMSTASTSQPHTQDTIDLTLEDDSPSPERSTTRFASQNVDTTSGSGTIGDRPIARAPPFVPQDVGQIQPVIDLSSDDEDDHGNEGDEVTTIDPASPEIQFMGARELPQPMGPPTEPGHRRPQLPLNPTLGHHFNTMANFFRGMTHTVVTNFRGNRELPEEALNRIDGLHNYPAMGRAPVEMPPEGLLDEYDLIHMNYHQPAFNLGGQEFLLIEDPNLQPVPPARPIESAYKAPPPVRDGFTRNYEEDDMLVCGLCGDELATGNTDQKKQVWIVKQCGHAYCGDCAHSRSISKQKNNRDTRRAAGKKTNNFNTCAIPDCNKAVNSKTKMFQIYL